jgi:hypothetical protein
MGHASEMIVAAGAGNASVSKWNSFQVDGSAVGWLAYGERMLCDYSLFGLCFHQMNVCTLYTWYGCGFLTVHWQRTVCHQMTAIDMIDETILVSGAKMTADCERQHVRKHSVYRRSQQTSCLQWS